MFEIVSDDFKIISVKNFKNPNFIQYIFISNTIEKNYRKYPPNNITNFNFPILEKDNFFRLLYDDFIKINLEIFKNFTVKSNNKNICWCYRSSKKYYNSFFHDHSTSSVINGVYYLKSRRGSISFLKNGKYLKYFPEDNELLIFPGSLTHKPDRPLSRKKRYSINMELMTEESFLFLFDSIS